VNYRLLLSEYTLLVYKNNPTFELMNVSLIKLMDLKFGGTVHMRPYIS